MSLYIFSPSQKSKYLQIYKQKYIHICKYLQMISVPMRTFNAHLGMDALDEADPECHRMAESGGGARQPGPHVRGPARVNHQGVRAGVAGGQGRGCQGGHDGGKPSAGTAQGKCLQGPEPFNNR